MVLFIIVCKLKKFLRLCSYTNGCRLHVGNVWLGFYWTNSRDAFICSCCYSTRLVVHQFAIRCTVVRTWENEYSSSVVQKSVARLVCVTKRDTIAATVLGPGMNGKSRLHALSQSISVESFWRELKHYRIYTRDTRSLSTVCRIRSLSRRFAYRQYALTHGLAYVCPTRRVRNCSSEDRRACGLDWTSERAGLGPEVMADVST